MLENPVNFLFLFFAFNFLGSMSRELNCYFRHSVKCDGLTFGVEFVWRLVAQNLCFTHAVWLGLSSMLSSTRNPLLASCGNSFIFPFFSGEGIFNSFTASFSTLSRFGTMSVWQRDLLSFSPFFFLGCV